MCRRYRSARPLLPILTVALGVAWLLAGIASVQATPSPIPARLFPAGAHVTYMPSVSNHDVDCLWGFVCDGNAPNFHFHTEDQLHRAGGWALFAGQHDHGQNIEFEMFVSHYPDSHALETIPWSAQAFLDLTHAIERFYPVNELHGPRLLPSGGIGNQLVQRRRGSYVLGCWMGSTEIEAIVAYDHVSSAQVRLAQHDLVGQVRLAMQESQAH